MKIKLGLKDRTEERETLFLFVKNIHYKQKFGKKGIKKIGIILLNYI